MIDLLKEAGVGWNHKKNEAEITSWLFFSCGSGYQNPLTNTYIALLLLPASFDAVRLTL